MFDHRPQGDQDRGDGGRSSAAPEPSRTSVAIDAATRPGRRSGRPTSLKGPCSRTRSRSESRPGRGPMPTPGTLRDVVERPDVVIVGGGVMGTAAARALSSRGRAVVLLERFTFGHGSGSSGGPTRIFRLTYDDPDYVRMARAALAPGARSSRCPATSCSGSWAGSTSAKATDLSAGRARGRRRALRAGPRRTRRRAMAGSPIDGAPVLVRTSAASCGRTKRPRAGARWPRRGRSHRERRSSPTPPSRRGDGVEVRTTDGRHVPGPRRGGDRGTVGRAAPAAPRASTCRWFPRSNR